MRGLLAGYGYAEGQTNSRGDGRTWRDALASAGEYRHPSSPMKALQLAAPGDRLSVLCLGAHSDDIEIGAGATLLSMQERGIRLDVHWCVLSGGGEREREAKASAKDFLAAAQSSHIEVMSFKDSFFPEQGDAIKSWFTMLRERVDPDLVLPHGRGDAH